MIQFKDMVTLMDFEVTEETTLKQAIGMLKEKKWNLLPVTDEEGFLKGVFTRSGLYGMLLDEKPLHTPIKDYIKRDAKTVSIDTSYEKIEQLVGKSDVGTGVVLNKEGKVAGLFTKTEMVMALLRTADALKELETVKKLQATLETALEHAYDGILMTDQHQLIQMVNPSLLDFFGLEREEVLHRKVDEVLPQIKLSKVYQTELAEISDFKESNGIKYLVHRIPIIENGQLVGALGKIVFRQLNEVNELFRKWQKAESKAKFYHQQLEKTESARYTWEHIFTIDPQMEKLKKSAAKAARGRSTILIRGESGTGKELFAHAIHNSSARRNGKFVVVNCAAIPEDLLESEFFGYEEGSFTGARKRGKIGKFDLANGGTLFLDEIGDMSLTLQAKLLRVLQEREFYRVGGTSKIKVDVRIIAATNQNLEEMVRQGQFREDLYYRLNVISLNIPPLRARVPDTGFLLGVLIKELNMLLGTSITGIENEAHGTLLGYSWPGNVRELRNVMERAMTFAEHGKIQLEDLPDYLLGDITSAPGNGSISTVEEAEHEAIQRALSQTQGNKAKAARILGISRSGLYEKLKKYELNV
ncbi:sigma-54-dependent Fis family transcriptional regulator [Bacillus sp. FJAT-27251]|uniref:sigma-54-dependent Fis family transcriptional regulator n=1 Tax=Bacillus sp. FJAT-27251 TaxID=1684142 RepID=UPI0006A7C49A|nr:sigma-54-dependent Fis family transcriptional regulator [Bacillus sp. FJAT-27251]